MVEAIVNLLVGFGASWVVQRFVVGMILGVQVSTTQSFWIVVLFTMMSFIRQYALRRMFNRWHVIRPHTAQ
jgi:hypothetical protein